MGVFRQRYLVTACLVLLPALLIASEKSAETDDSSQKEDSADENGKPQLAGFPIRKIPDRWQILYQPGDKGTLMRYARRFQLDRPCPLKFKGPYKGYAIGQWSAGGVFSITRERLLASPKDHTAALHLGTAENFHLQTAMNRGGTGSNFVLFGWTGDSGYLLHHFDPRPFSKWSLLQYDKEKDQFVPVEELSRYQWKEWKPFEMVVRKGTLTVRVGSGFVCRDVELEDYTTGQIFLGTALTDSGPKHLKIRAMRIRSLD